ncbi:SUMF1/EgtB/PvdO family nonheme iron enzyme [Streptosporangium sp. NPDC051023]|uniref:NACHT domain-containing protein n=1 Tax=Streptosporangium sp. NPDC051023 TaxID=3155410 RepID=UPI00344DA0DC
MNESERSGADWLLPAVGEGLGPSGQPSRRTRILRSYLTRLTAHADCLEFGDPSEFLATLNLVGSRKAKLTDVWVMPMVCALALGATRQGVQFSANPEVPLDRVLFESNEPTQVILGRAGSGKSTVCRYVAARLATDMLEGDVSREVIPLLVPARTINFQSSADPVTCLVHAALKEIPGISRSMETEMANILLTELDRCQIIVDGFDEVPPGRLDDAASGTLNRTKLHSAIVDFQEAHPSGRVLLTSRDSEYRSSTETVLPTAFHYAIGTFSREQVEKSIERWHRAATASAAARGETLRDWDAREASLLELVRFDPDLGKLAEVPLLLNLMQIVFRPEDDFPRNISEVASRAIQFLMVKNPRSRRNGDPETGGALRGGRDEIVIEALRLLAYRITLRENAAGDQAFAPGDIFDALDSVVEGHRMTGRVDLTTARVAELVEYVERGHGIVIQTGPRRYEFSHNVFREVLTGQQLDQLEPAELTTLLTDPRWLLPLRYWAGWKATGTREAATYVSSVASELVEYGRSAHGRERAIALLAVGEMVIELTRPGSVVGGWASIRLMQTLIVGLLVDLLEDQTFEFPLRVRIGDALGSLGDPRVEALAAVPGSFVASLVPLTPAGPITFGRRTPHRVTREKYAKVPASPQVERLLLPFSVGLLPVTNLEYARFIRAGGYRTASYWTSGAGRNWMRNDPDFLAELRTLVEEAAEIHFQTEILAGRITREDLRAVAHRQLRRSAPLYWHHPRFNRPNQPVVGVNYWEAEAYCVWLTRWLADNGCLPEGHAIRLPTEFEWEFAARRDGTGPYPWGVEPPSSGPRAHTMDHRNSAVGRTCAVGIFPWARWADGPLDIVGNVWEWTGSRPDLYTLESVTVDAVTDSMSDRVTRGGSWLSQEPESGEVTFRTFDPPFNAYEDLGIRVILARAR